MVLKICLKLGIVVLVFRLRPLLSDKSHLVWSWRSELVLIVVSVGIEHDSWLVLGVTVLVLLSQLALVVFLRMHVWRVVQLSLIV